METIQIESPEDLKQLMNVHRYQTKRIVSKEAQEIAEEIAEREWDLFELNLFISSSGKRKLNKITKEVQELRKKVDIGEVDLSEYENMAEDF